MFSCEAGFAEQKFAPRPAPPDNSLGIGDTRSIVKKLEVTQAMDTIALILSIIGSLNWGLVGIFKFDLVAWIFGGQTAVVSRIVYTLVGLAGLWCISLLFRQRGSSNES